MKKLLFFSLLISGFISYSQNINLSGTIQSAEDGETIPGATIAVINPSDSSLAGGSVTDFNGFFQVTGLPKGTFYVQISFIGFQPLIDTISLERNLDLGILQIKEQTQVLGAVEVVAKPTATMQKGDTVQFSAGAYQTAKDASSQELIEKLPGITTEDGKLQANGEDIQVILVDGKPFFGGDVSAALQNLPAEVVASIQIYDKKSDKAALSGFDDGERQKTINIITKPDRKKGQFGKSTIGLGTGETYNGAASINFFNNDRRITVTGFSNNINTIKYSSDPNNIGDAQNRNGLINTHSFGVNFNDDWGDRIEFSGNYQYSNQNTTDQQNMRRDYAVDSDSAQIYEEDRSTERTEDAHNFNLKVKYEDDKNTVIMRPNFRFDYNRSNNDFTGQTTIGNERINSTRNVAEGYFRNYDYFNNIYYSHKFDKKGRAITTGVRTGIHPNKDFANQYAENRFFQGEDSLSIINQETTRERKGLSWGTQVSYTEPLGEKSMMEIEYEISDKIDDSDKLTYDVDELQEFRQIDTTLSNTFDSKYLRQEAELGYQFKTEKFRVQVETEYQVAKMTNEQQFPKPFDQRRTFTSILPSARVNYHFNEDKRIEMDYRTWTNNPDISQLQDVIDNSNPLQLSSGNPDLAQTYYHSGRLRFWSNNMETEKSFFATVYTQMANNLITTASIIADDPIEIADGITLSEGSQYRFPVNIDGYFYGYYYMSYGQPISLIKSNIRLYGGLRYSRRPGQINDLVNYSNNNRYWFGLSLSSNISEKIDFNVSARTHYNVVTNSVRPVLNNDYYTHSTDLKYRWVFFDGFVYRANLAYQLNTGLSDGYDNSSLLMNMSAGKKFLKNDLAEISINVYDLLQQNNNANRNINELFIEDRQSTVLQRYFMLTFTYNIRHFSPGTTIEDFKEI
ncbi:MAG: TonB-dependent receptor [Cyclobacteriaceae bacterium]|nr:TonB-dependent receptor [Cyclobacteriaceae bacterium SS2]